MRYKKLAKKTSLILLFLALLVNFTFATYKLTSVRRLPHISSATIDGFEQLRLKGNLSLNATALNFFTSNTSRFFVTDIGIGTKVMPL